MISRVAESCFWLFRYLERAENTARLLAVQRSFILDLDLPDLERWHPLVIVSGEEKGFGERHPDDLNDGEVVQEYLTWSEDCLVSILSSIRWGRENARMIREVISPDMWESLNSFWHWLNGKEGRKTYRRSRDDFYHRVLESCALFQGLSHNTMLHEEPFDFMRLGMLLERAGWTARILDVKHHALGPTLDVPRPGEVAQWSALLQSCGATELFLKRFGGVLEGRMVAEFLILEPNFPRSILHCLDRAWNFLRRIRPEQEGPIGMRSADLLGKLVEEVRTHDIDRILSSGLHRELTRLIQATTEVCEAVDVDYFDPPLRIDKPIRRSKAGA